MDFQPDISDVKNLLHRAVYDGRETTTLKEMARQLSSYGRSVSWIRGRGSESLVAQARFREQFDAIENCFLPLHYDSSGSSSSSSYSSGSSSSSSSSSSSDRSSDSISSDRSRDSIGSDRSSASLRSGSPGALLNKHFIFFSQDIEALKSMNDNHSKTIKSLAKIAYALQDHDTLGASARAFIKSYETAKSERSFKPKIFMDKAKGKQQEVSSLALLYPVGTKEKVEQINTLIRPNRENLISLASDKDPENLKSEIIQFCRDMDKHFIVTIGRSYSFIDKKVASAIMVNTLFEILKVVEDSNPQNYREIFLLVSNQMRDQHTDLPLGVFYEHPEYIRALTLADPDKEMLKDIFQSVQKMVRINVNGSEQLKSVYISLAHSAIRLISQDEFENHLGQAFRLLDHELAKVFLDVRNSEMSLQEASLFPSKTFDKKRVSEDQGLGGDGEIPKNSGKVFLSEDFLSYAIEIIRENGNYPLAELYISVSPDTDEAIKEIRDLAVSENFDEMIASLIVRFNISDADKREIIDKMYMQGNLSAIHKIYGNGWEEVARDLFYLRAVQGQKIPVKEILLKCFLNSEYEDFIKFVDCLENTGFSQKVAAGPNNLQNYLNYLKTHEVIPAISELREFVAVSGALVVRFPSPRVQQMMYDEYKERTGSASYEEQQFNYGNIRKERVLSVLYSIQKEGGICDLSGAYAALRGNLETRSKSADEGGATVTYITGRYSQFRLLAFEALKSPDITPGLVRIEESAIQFIDEEIVYDGRHPIEAKICELTKLQFTWDSGGSLEWLHTQPPDDPGAWFNQMHIGDDFTRLLRMEVGKNDAVQIGEFKRRVAEFYWKGAHLMPTARGNAQTMLELHQLLYLSKELPLPIPARKTVMPDCIALCCTKQKFVDVYYASCWEELADDSEAVKK